MTFRMKAPMSEELHEFLGTQHNSLWPPMTTDGRDRYLLRFEAPSASYHATRIIPDILYMLQTFPDLVLNGSQDFTIDGDFYRLVILNNDTKLLEGHVVYQ